METKHLPALIICGFPGVGKTHASRVHGWQDSDSSGFSWVSDGVRNPDFPQNYIEHLKKSRGVILASSHIQVRDALALNRLPFWIVYPEKTAKEEYIERYRSRGSAVEFLALLDKKWDEWIMGMETESRCVNRIVLGAGEYLADVDELKDKR